MRPQGIWISYVRPRYVPSPPDGWRLYTFKLGLVEQERDGVSTREARPPYTFSYLHAPRPMGHGSTTDKSV